MQSKKVIVLCNNKIAIPALKELIFFNQVTAIIIPQKNKELPILLNELLDEKKEIEILIVSKQNFADVIEEKINEKNIEAVLMMTFPYLIPGRLLTLPPKGFINFHYGKLPEYRGAEPIFAQMVHQEKNIFLAVHIVTEGLDEGGIIIQECIERKKTDTYGLVQQALADLGAKLVTVLMKILQFGSFLPSTPQDESIANYYAKPTVKDLMIDFTTMDSNQIQALVCACNPWNKGAGLIIKNTHCQVLEVTIINNESLTLYKPGEIIKNNAEDGLQIATLDNKIIKINIIYTENGFSTTIAFN